MQLDNSQIVLGCMYIISVKWLSMNQVNATSQNGNDNIVFDLGKPIAPRTHVSGKVNPRTPIMIKKKHIQDDNNHGNIYWLVVWNIFIFPYIGNNNPN